MQGELKKMKKVFKIVLLVTLLTQVSASGKVIDDFFEQLVKKTKGSADNVAREIASHSKVVKEQIKSKLDNIPKVPKAIKEDNSKALIASKADDIVKKGDFEKQFFLSKNFDEQMTIIVQSQKYGDEYFTVASKISADDLKHLSQNPNIAKYLPQSKFQNLTQDQLQSKFIDALEKTGNAGWKVLKGIGEFAVKNPLLAGVSGAYLWFSVDPDSFMEAFKKSGKSAVDFVSSIITGLGSGVAEAVVDKAEKTVESITKEIMQGSVSYITSLVTGVFVLIIGFIIWRKRKRIYNFLTQADEILQDKQSDISRKNKKEEGEF